MDTNAYIKKIEECIAKGPYKDDWASLSKHQTPSWFTNAKFGIFIHWGIYSVPAFANEWYSRNMYIQGTAEFEHHRKTYGEHKEFGYKDFIPIFTAEQTSGWNSLSNPAHSTSFLLQSITTAFKCIKVIYPFGMPITWDQSETS